MRPSRNQREKYGNRPAATRGITEAFQKLMRPNPEYPSLLDELDVEIRSYSAKDFRITSGGEPVKEGSYKDLGRAKSVFQQHIQQKVADGWQKLNERKDYTLKPADE